MIKTYVVGPFYYIPTALRDTLTSNTTIIITDDVSPIFPLDTRMEWLNFTFLDYDTAFESMVQNDESDEFFQALDEKIAKLVKEDEIDDFRTVVFLHPEAYPKIGSGFDHTLSYDDVHKIESPLTVRKEEMDALFTTRFGKKFDALILPKVKPLGKENNLIIPWFLERGIDQDGNPITHKYYGAIWAYDAETTDDTIQLFAFPIDFGTPIAETKTIIKLFCSRVVGTPSTSERLAGYHNNLPIWLVEIPQPDNIYTSSAKGLRSYLAVDADVTFVKDSYLRDAMGALGYKIETLHQEVLADEKA
jgi:hypothetical protein